MAQKQFTNFQDDILSFDLREAMLGVLKPGRYCGFDTVGHVSTGGGVINVNVSHAGTGIQKANKALPTPALSSKTGVYVTTQGGIIHEDTTFNIAVAISAGTGDRYDIIYGEHTFLDGTPGSNPATFNIRQGTAGAGTPSLSLPSKQVPLILVKIPNNVTTYAGLTFTPYKNELGDLTISTTLASMLGTLNGYSEQNYITNNQSVTASLNALDMILKDKSDLITTLQGTKLDDWAIPDDNTDLNATTARHGLLPKLANDATKFLNGLGNWVIPAGSNMTFATSGYLASFDEDSLGYVYDADPDYATVEGELDLSTYLPAGATAVILRYVVEGYGADLVTDQTINTFLHLANPDYPLVYHVQANSLQIRKTISGVVTQYDWNSSGMGIIPISSARKLAWQFQSTDGRGHCRLYILGYVKPAS